MTPPPFSAGAWRYPPRKPKTPRAPIAIAAVLLITAGVVAFHVVPKAVAEMVRFDMENGVWPHE